MSPAVEVNRRTRMLRRIHRLVGLRDAADVRERDGRIAGAMFGAAALYTLAVAPFAGVASHRAAQYVVMMIMLASAAVAYPLPWRALPRWAMLAPSVWILVVYSIGVGVFSGALEAYVAVYLMVFAYAGLTLRPVVTLRVVGLAEAGLLIAVLVGNQHSGRVTVAAAILLAAAVGQSVRLAQSWNAGAHDRLARLREALTALATADSEVVAARKVAHAMVRLLDADHAVVLLAEHPGSSTFVCRGTTTDPELTADVRIDLAHEQSGAVVAARSGLPLFISDARTSPVASKRLVEQFGVASAVYLPIPGEGGVMGAVVAWWGTRQHTLDEFALETSELLPAPAGQLLARLRHAGQRDAAALTDQLTGIGNRRRFDAGLTELPAGGAILVFDLDSLKTINTLHGLDAGDDILRAFADALKRCVRDGDVVSRLGGDDFGVILPIVSSPIAGGIIIERLQRMWRMPHGCRFSVGIALRTADETPLDALTRAEVDLQATKQLKSA